MDFSINLSI